MLLLVFSLVTSGVHRARHSGIPSSASVVPLGGEEREPQGPTDRRAAWPAVLHVCSENVLIGKAML